ncbi:MAG: triacylglycerol lipase [Desulforhopalus sp.]
MRFYISVPLNLRVKLVTMVVGVSALLLSGCGGKAELVVRLPAIKTGVSECVVLIHGMGRSAGSMSEMQEVLLREGYETVSLGYSSTTKDIESIVREDYPTAVESCMALEPETIHFVTHSLGGIVLRKAFSSAEPDNLGRVVMLSPPNQGSKLVDKIKTWWLFRWLMGPAGQQIGTDENSVPRQLGKADFNLGIITGNSHAFFDSWFASIIPGLDDGKVSVESAQLEGMDDFLVTNDTHPFIMNSEYVQQETVYFLQHGEFAHERVGSPGITGEDWFSD